jgi:transposase
VKTKERRSRQHYSPELKLKLVKKALKASEEGSSVAALAREYGVNDNLLFKWMRLWQNEGRIHDWGDRSPIEHRTVMFLQWS